MAFGGNPTAGAVLDRIRLESRDKPEKGRWFEQLFMRIALQELEFEIDSVWRRPEWPEGEELAGRPRSRNTTGLYSPSRMTNAEPFQAEGGSEQLRCCLAVDTAKRSRERFRL